MISYSSNVVESLPFLLLVSSSLAFSVDSVSDLHGIPYS